MTVSELLLIVLALFVGTLLVLGFLIWVLSIRWRGPEDTRAVAVLRILNRIYVRLFHRMWRSFSADPLPSEGACIVVANHQSGVDPHLLAAVTQRWIRFLMAREFYDIRGLRWFFRTLDSIPVRRDGNDLGATRTALKHLKAGHVIGIFPQGGIRDVEDSLGMGKAGTALLALRTGAPVVPLYISGAPAGESVFRALFRPSRSRVYDGKRLHFPKQERKPTREDLNQVTAEILKAIAELKSTAHGEAQGSEARSLPEAVRSGDAGAAEEDT